MNVLLLSMPDSFEHTPTVSIRMPNGALTLLAGNVDALIGMTILWGLTKQGDDNYQGGEILDPETGKIYRVKIRLEEGGKKLDVRGIIGFSLLGRSQTWIREE